MKELRGEWPLVRRWSGARESQRQGSCRKREQLGCPELREESRAVQLGQLSWTKNLEVRC